MKPLIVFSVQCVAAATVEPSHPSHLNGFDYRPATRVRSLLNSTGQPCHLNDFTYPLLAAALSNSWQRVRGLPETPPGDLPPVIKLTFAAPPQSYRFSGADWLDGAAQTLPTG